MNTNPLQPDDDRIERAPDDAETRGREGERGRGGDGAMERWREGEMERNDGLPGDELDALLREWHQIHATAALAARDRILNKVLEQAVEDPSVPRSLRPAVSPFPTPPLTPSEQSSTKRKPIAWRSVMTRYSPIAAVFVLVAILIPVIQPDNIVKTAKAQELVLVPEGGRLEALDAQRQIIGPCPLKGTDVDVAISGRFTRVTIRQQFHNPYPDKIEAVYTFPMSHRAAVDQMVMTVGDRVVVGEVKERQRARRIYEAAREAGHVASLLEQERPNIFTQSVANIEPGAEIDVQISYVELLESKDGTFNFDFPMVVEPRYIPGTPTTSPGALISKFQPRRGVIILGPAAYQIVLEGDTTTHGQLTAETLSAVMSRAQAIVAPEEASPERKLMARFEARYAGNDKEVGEFYTDGTGHVNGRWFCVPLEILTQPGAAFSPDTNQVPDASKISPMPVRPEQRAGHDISINVTIDTGGPGIVDLKTPLHDTIQTRKVQRDDGTARKLTVELKKERDIPNRDFVLSWRQTADTIEEAVFTHAGPKGKFVSLILQPPARVTDAQAVARELVFVMDTSGSMSGLPIEKSKEVMAKAVATMRPQDTFNLITFSGDTHILWPQPQPGTPENITAAQNFINGQRGGGGTEMMTAIEAALMQPERELAPMRICCFMTDGEVGNDMAIIEAVQKYSKTTRVFSFGIGNSVNRYLLDGMAKAGRGEVEYVLLNSDADAAVKQFTQRIQTPVLTNVELVFSDGLKVTEMVPKTIPDLFDVKPIIVHAKYTTPGSGTLTIRGQTGSGKYERTIPLELPAVQPEHDTIATLWARAKVEALMNEDLAAAQTGNYPKELHDEVVSLGETYGIMTQYTSFVAVEKQRVTVGGRPRLVHVPIEMPQGVSFEGIFGLEAVMPRRFAVSNSRQQLSSASAAVPTTRPAVASADQTRPLDALADQTVQYTARLRYDMDGKPTAHFAENEWRLVTNGDPRYKQMSDRYARWGDNGNADGIATNGLITTVMPDSTAGIVDGKTVSGANFYAFDAGNVAGMGAGYADFDGDADGADNFVRLRNLRPADAGGGRGATPQNMANYWSYYDANGATTTDAVTGVGGLQPRRFSRLSALPGPGGPAGNRHGFSPYGAPAASQPAASDQQVEGYSGRRGEIVRRYPVGNGDVVATAKVLDRMLLDQYGYEAPYVKALPDNSELLVCGEPQMMEQVEKNLAALGIVVPATQPAGDPGTTTQPAAPVLASATLRTMAWLELLSTDKQLEPARKMLVPQRIAIQIAKLVKDGLLDDAKALAEALVKFDGEFKTGVWMRAALNDKAMAVADRDRQIEALSNEAKRAFDPIIRDIKLRRRLDGRLYGLAAAGPAAATQPAPAGVELKDGKVRVTVIAADTQAPTLAALRQAGLEIEGSAERTRMVIGLVARERIGDVGAIDQVKRIEPTEPLD